MPSGAAATACTKLVLSFEWHLRIFIFTGDGYNKKLEINSTQYKQNLSLFL